MPIADRTTGPVIGARWLPLVLLVAALAAPGIAHAAPLDQAACEKLQSEHAELVKAGAPEAMRKGPAWAKANLPADKVTVIERFIGLEEQLLFRCDQDKARAQPVPEPAAATAAGAAAASATAAGAVKGPAAAKGPPIATEPKAKPKTKPKPKPKPRPKAKADDAFRPPPAQSAPAAPTAGPSVRP